MFNKKEEENVSMRIMSYNILCAGRGKREWKRRTKRVIKTIKNINPDTFGVQEAHHEWMEKLTAGLPEYSYVGVGRDDGRQRGEYSAVFYKKDKYDLIGSSTFWLSETPDVPGYGWDAACRRVCSYAILREKETGKKFVHFNTHLDHRGTVAMQKGAELVAVKANEICTDCPAFFTGDFNVTPDSLPYKAVIDGGFSDARLTAAETDDSYTYHDFENPDCDKCIIDYVFTKGDVKVDRFRVVKDLVDGDIPSDHYPVYADVEF